MSVAEIESVVERLEELLAGFDPLVCEGATARRYVQVFAAVERLGAAGKTLALSQVQRSGAWARDGKAVRSAAEWLSATTGVPHGEAIREVETARRLDGLPATADALRAGHLSAAQAHQISTAAAEAPAAEQALLVLAQRSGSFTLLREEASRVKAAAADETRRAERQHGLRRARRWTDHEGMRRYDVALTPEQAAGFEPVWDSCYRQVFEAARRRGTHEPAEAYAADALVVVAERAVAHTTPTSSSSSRNGDGTGEHDRRDGGHDLTDGETERSRPGVAARALVLVDASALRRGHTIVGETCEIAGIGPIDVAAARRLLGDAAIDILVRDGFDVRTVAHVGRSPNSRQRAALLADWQCEVRGCTQTRQLEIDHLVPWAEGGPTTLDNLGPKCRFHHHLETHEGWTDGPRGNDGKRDLDLPDNLDRHAPDDPDPP